MRRRIVFDTNVLISGYLWNGSPRQALRFIKFSDYRLLICDETIGEFVRVLSLKFGLDAEDIYRAVSDVEGMSERIRVASKERPIAADPADNVFINLAIDGGAEAIVSGDSHLLRLESFSGIDIISVNRFLEAYRNQ